MKRGTVVMGALLVCLLIFGIRYMLGVRSYKAKVNSIQLQEMNIEELEDGVYTGACDTGLVAARVEVVVREGKITDIRLLEHKNERGKPAEAIIPEIIEKQTFPVDAVSGATSSSRVIQRAIENALTGNADT